MGQLLLVIVGELFFGALGLRAILWPEATLVSLGRPVTPKHLSATRFIGALFLLLVALALAQWLREPR